MSDIYLVTGAAGLVGSHLCERLIEQGDEVVGIDNFDDYYDPAQKRANVRDLLSHERFTLHEFDIRDAEGLMQIVRGAAPRSIAHLAGLGGVRYSIGRARLYTDVNIVGSVNVLEAARAANVELVVFASTSSVYGDTPQLPFVETDPCNLPLAPYPASKKAVEVLGHTYHNLHEMHFTALRFFSVYGPRARQDMMPFMVADRIEREQAIKLYDGGQMKRDWTYVGDIAAGVAAAMRKPLGYQIINLGRGEPVLMAEFVRLLENLAGKPAIIDDVPAPASEPKITFANIDKARRLLDYDPQTPVEDGLARLWDWYKAEYVDA